MSFLKPSAFLPLCVLASFLILLSGCDDPDARSKADEAMKETGKLKALIEESKTKNDALEASIKAMEERLKKQIDSRFESIAADVAANHKRVLEQVSQDVKINREAAVKMADTARMDNDKELSATKAVLAENMQTIRAELAAEAEKLRKFMDNQLKETYPYAYQPRRMDPAAPPGEPAPKAPKAEPEAPK